MVIYCTVCMNSNRSKKYISYFNYPNDCNRRHEWLKAVGREDLLAKLVDKKTRQQYRICEDHFEKTCIKYSKNRTVKYLFDHAFPTLGLPSTDGASSSQCESVSAQETQNIPIIPELQISSNSNNPLYPVVILNDQTSTDNVQVDTSNFQNDNPERKSSQTDIQLLTNTSKKKKVALQLQEHKQSKICDLDSVTKDDFLKLCDKFVTKGISQIIKWQIDLKTGCSRNRDSEAFNFFALNLHYSGPTAYRFLTNTFCLPSISNLQKLVMPTGTKTDERLFSALKLKVDKMGSQEKICSVCVYSMPLKANLYYDIRNDRIIGFHEVNGIQKPEPAKYVLFLMIRGIIHNWKQPIAHSFLSKRKNYPEVNAWIDEVITSLLDIGLDIRYFVSEFGSDFIGASKSRSVGSDKTHFEVIGHKIYYIFDVPQLIKSVRDNLKTCDFIFDDKVAKWSHIRDMYDEDKKQEIRLAHKLTDIHINPKGLQKMRVDLALQLLSNTVGSAINTYVDSNLNDTSARDTADFVNKINDLFDVLNSSTLRSTNKFKRAFCGDDYQIEFLKEMLIFFKHLKLVTIDTKTDVTNTMNFIRGFQVSIKSLLQLYVDLQQEGIKFIYTRRLNQDSIENFFSKVRQANNGQKPTCRQASSAFKKAFVCNILKKPEGINCDDEDFDDMLTKQEDCHTLYATSSQVLHSEDIPTITIGTNDYQFDLPEKNTLLYVSGYLYKKCINQHKCEKSEDSLFPHYKRYNDDTVQPGFFIIPPDNFVAFIGLLENKFLQHFDLDVNIVHIGNEILGCMQDCTFAMPCECFPIDYLKKLYVRFRIYHTIKRNNTVFRNNKFKKCIFRVSSL